MSNQGYVELLHHNGFNYNDYMINISGDIWCISKNKLLKVSGP